MHRAPAVSFPVVRSLWHRRVIGALLALGVSAGLAFLAHDNRWGWRQGVLVVALATAAVRAWQDWQRTTTGVLCWDSSQWTWEAGSNPTPCTVHRVLDFQVAMILRLNVQQDRYRYCWLEARAAPARWLALRRALVSSARHPAQPPHMPAGTDRRGGA